MVKPCQAFLLRCCQAGDARIGPVIGLYLGEGDAQQKFRGQTETCC